VLANRTRLRIFGLLFRQPNQTVSAVAQHLKLPLPVASQYLRALESRGLLTVRRVGGRVYYRISAAPSGAAAPELIEALERAFQQDRDPVEKLFKLATAFTQPRRIDLFRALTPGPQTAGQLQARTRISGRALARHLTKLVARGFVVCREGKYSVTERQDGFGGVLARLAVR
jgi:DNA-binding transcriptional ArsR family regulator